MAGRPPVLWEIVIAITGVSLLRGASCAGFSLLLQDNDITQNIRKRLISLS